MSEKQTTNKKESTPKKTGQSGLPTPPNRNKFSPYIMPLIIGITILSMYLLGNGKNPIETDWQEFRNQMLLPGDVKEMVIINKQFVEITIKEEKLKQKKYEKVLARGNEKNSKLGPHYKFEISSVDKFMENLDAAQREAGFAEADMIYPKSKTNRNIMGNLLEWLLPLAILVIIWIFIFRRMSGGGGPGGSGNIFNVGKSRAKIFDKENGIKIDFKDVAGLEEAKVEIKEIVDFLKKPDKYTELGGKIPKGALLVGPPGTGKTLLAKAVAGEANVPFFSMSGSDFVEMFVGVGASRVRDLFKQAKEKAPCIIFIDEIDAIGRARGKNANMPSNDERENTLNQLLTEMDGFATNTGVIILAATNRADILDRALLRAGRFDRQIHVELPDLKERLEIFKVHLKPLKLEQGLDIEFLAKQTPGFSGADIANVCNESALIAARQEKKSVQKQDFLDAIDRIIGGLERKNKIITRNEKRTIAFHEAGHATVSWMLEHANPLLKVTIIPRGKALGAAWYLPEERQITTKEQLLDEMCSLLGGRASEQHNFGKLSTGALNDLERVTKMAYAMVTYFGLSEKLGNISYYDSSGQSEYMFTKPYGDKTSELIDQEVKRIIDEQYSRALQVLKDNDEGLSKLGNLLLEKEVIFSEDLETIFGKRKFVADEVVHLTNIEPSQPKKSRSTKKTEVTESAAKKPKATVKKSVVKKPAKPKSE